LGLGLLLTLGTLTTFGAIGMLFSLVGSALGRYLPYLNLFLGLGLLAMGVLTLIGKGWGLNLQFRTPTGQGSGQFYGFGLAYGLASLGCTLPVFLSVAGFALSRGPVSGASALLAYGLGMGTVLTMVSLLVGLGQEGMLKRLRQGGEHLEQLGVLLLLLAGGYLAGYQLALIFQVPTGARWLGIGLGLLAVVIGYGLRRWTMREVADAG
jgi:cytochrome c biogenesis protein CcdA